MALLERITTMKQQGASETQIINTLKEEGVSPLEINEAISQLKIKAAVSSNEYDQMQSSVMAPSPESQFSSAQAQENPAAYAPAYQGQQQYMQQQAYAPEQQQYAPEGTYYQQAADVETIRDIAKQVVEESIQKMREEISSLSKMKSDMKFEMQDIENRLVKIENIIQELQTSIIRRMGQYGESIAGISQEVRATQDAFTKMINPIMDKRNISKQNQIQEETEEQVEPTQEEQVRATAKSQEKKIQQNQASSRTTGNSGVSFEDYFR
jgi:hypothetical protein